MNFTSINTVMDRITRHPLLQDLNQESIVDYAVDFMKIVGIPPTFLEKTELIKIENYRGILPCDYYEVIQVRLARHEKCAGTQWEYWVKHPVFRNTTDSFHMSRDKGIQSDLTYKIQGSCIYTSPMENGVIEMAYKAIGVDEDGYPLIPDDSIFLRALEAYIKKQWFTIQFDLGKLNPQIMQKADQDYAWAAGQAQSSLIMPTLDQMQAISNMWNTLIPRMQEHKRGFVHSGTVEHLRIH